MKREISKLVSDGSYREALCFYSQTHSASLRPNKFTFPSIFKACSKLKSASHGQILHTHLIKTGFGTDTYASTALTDMYMKLRLLDDARKTFDEMPDPNLASLNSLISGLSQNGYCKESLRVLRAVGEKRFRPNSITIASLLSGCESIELNRQVHCWAVKLGFEAEVSVGTSLITVYSSSAELVSATKVFEMILNRNVVTYNAYMTGLLKNEVPKLVLDVFKDMRNCLFSKPNVVTLVSVISACSNLQFLRFGRQVHGFIKKVDMGLDTMVGTALVDMYSKCGCLEFAYNVFNELNGSRSLITWNSMIAGMMLNGQCETAIELFAQLDFKGFEPDSATWNSMISGFSQQGKEVEAFMFFRKMQSHKVKPSLKSITSLLPACSALSTLRCGKEIHAHTIRTDIHIDEFISTSLIDMYMKCGQSSWARKIFARFEIRTRDPAIWNAMIFGYGRNGENESAFQIFDRMLEEKVKPNSATFNGILTVCSHTGEVDKGWEVFRMMVKDYGLNPTPEHFSCMVDLLGRSGQVDKAWELLEQVPEASASGFASLLGACKWHSDSKLGEEMAKKLSELEPENPFPYVILSNIYAAEGRWRDVEKVRKTMDDRVLTKVPGLSLTGMT